MATHAARTAVTVTTYSNVLRTRTGSRFDAQWTMDRRPTILANKRLVTIGPTSHGRETISVERDRFVSTVRSWSTVLAVLYSCAGGALADDADPAKQPSNPVAPLISVPFQFNYDRDFLLNDEWTLISRTILPVIWRNDIDRVSGKQSELGNPWRSTVDRMSQNRKPEVSA